MLDHLELSNSQLISMTDTSYTSIYSKIIKLGNPISPFSIAITPRCRGGYSSFTKIAKLTLDTYLIMLSVRQGGMSTIFSIFGMTRSSIESRSPGTMANNLPLFNLSCLWLPSAKLLSYFLFVLFSTFYQIQWQPNCRTQ